MTNNLTFEEPDSSIEITSEYDLMHNKIVKHCELFGKNKKRNTIEHCFQTGKDKLKGQVLCIKTKKNYVYKITHYLMGRGINKSEIVNVSSDLVNIIGFTPIPINEKLDKDEIYNHRQETHWKNLYGYVNMANPVYNRLTCVFYPKDKKMNFDVTYFEDYIIFKIDCSEQNKISWNLHVDIQCFYVGLVLPKIQKIYISYLYKKFMDSRHNYRKLFDKHLIGMIMDYIR